MDPSPQSSAPAPSPLSPISLPPPPKSARATGAVTEDGASATEELVSKIVDDGDLIEKEWVNRAKQLVLKNRSDPYRQSEELMVLKADYMRKRYGKTIKLSK